METEGMKIKIEKLFAVRHFKEITKIFKERESAELYKKSFEKHYIISPYSVIEQYVLTSEDENWCFALDGIPIQIE